jgi:hypothetical protein
MATLRARRRLQFGLRSLFVLTLIVAAFFAGIATERRRGESAIRTEARVRHWLGKNSYQLVVSLDRSRPTMDWDEWIAEGRTIPSAEPALRAMLWSRDSTVELPLVAAALGQLGNGESVPALIDALNSNEIYITIAAANSLGELKDARAVEPLGTAFGLTTDENIRANIAAALGQIGGSNGRRYLRIAAEDDSKFVADIAKEALTGKNPASAAERSTTEE